MHLTIRTAKSSDRDEAVAVLIFSDDKNVPVSLKTLDRRCLGEVGRAI